MVDTYRMLLMYSMYFVVVTLLFQLLAKHSSAALLCKRFVRPAPLSMNKLTTEYWNSYMI